MKDSEGKRSPILSFFVEIVTLSSTISLKIVSLENSKICLGELREFREYASQLDGEYNAIPNKPKPVKKKKVEREKYAPKPPEDFPLYM